MGLRFSRQNYRCAGRRLRHAQDGGAHWWWGLTLCTRQGVGGGGGWGWLRVGAGRLSGRRKSGAWVTITVPQADSVRYGQPSGCDCRHPSTLGTSILASHL